MTKEEAIEIIKVARSEIEWEYPMDYAAAFDKAIEALESDVEHENTKSVIFQTPQGRQVRYIKCEVLDKIRAEIVELDALYDNDYFSGNKDAMLKRNEVLQIIDKYKAESEK